MQHTAVSSSSIKSIGYDDKTGHLQVTFSSGKTYQYEGVSPEVHRNFMKSESKGKFFADHIRKIPGKAL
jgi:hypothetical protein